MPDMIRVFGAFPIARSDSGHILADHDATARCESANAACLAAEQMARTAPYVARHRISPASSISLRVNAHAQKF
jgi:hypothetical protein